MGKEMEGFAGCAVTFGIHPHGDWRTWSAAPGFE